MTQNIPPKTGPAGEMAVSITSPGSAVGGIFAGINVMGSLQVMELTPYAFADSFEGSTPDSNKWLLTGTVPPTQSTGLINVNPGATASATSAVNTVPTFSTLFATTLGFSATIETTPATGNHRFMGWGTPPSPPGTAAAPLQDAIGFEIDTTGALRASVYTAGTRTFTAPLTRPVDGLTHRYVMTIRGDIVFWFMDTFDVPLVFTQTQPMTALLPIRLASLNSASVTGTPAMTVTATGAVDMARCAMGIADGTYPWRKAKVDSYGSLNVGVQAGGGVAVPARPDALLRVTLDPTAVFADVFDAALDTVDRWTTTGTAPTNANGTLTVDAATTALAWSGLYTKPTFPLLGNMFNQSVFIMQIDAAAKTGNYRFWGQGVAAASPTVAAPLVNAVGFDLDATTGALEGVVWSGGAKTQSVALTRPTDGAWHRYAIFYKTSRAYFEIDGVVGGSIAYPSPNVSNLPLLALSVNGASTVSPTATLKSSFIGVGDTSGNNTTLSDKDFPWRKAKVGICGDQAISITNPTAAAASLFAGVTSYGFLRTTTEPAALFSEPFDGASADTTNRWTTSGTVTPTVANGRISTAVAATLSASSAISTQASFLNVGINFLAVGWIAQFESINSTPGTLFYLNSHRFMGIGTVPATWVSAYTASSATGPLLNGIGFEIDTDGKMYPVLYSAGVRVRPSLTFGGSDFTTGNGTTLSPTNPGGLRALADGNLHQFGLAIRSDVIFWYVDGTDVPLASYSYRTAGFQPPDVQTLPARFHTINGASSAPSGTMVHRVGAIGVGDTGSNHSQIADGTYPWRKAAVSKTGGLASIPAPALLPSYTAAAETSTGAFSANTRKDYLSIEHAANSTKTVRVRRITVGGYQTGAVAGFIYAKVFYGTAASSAGTVQAATKTNEASAAADAVVKVLPTITAATLKISQPIGGLAATANIGVGPVTIYDATAGADQEPLTLRAGFLEALSVALYSTGTNTLLPSVTIYFTEE